MKNLGKSPRRLKSAVLDDNWSSKRRPQTTLQHDYSANEPSNSKYAFGSKVSNQKLQQS